MSEKYKLCTENNTTIVSRVSCLGLACAFDHNFLVFTPTSKRLRETMSQSFPSVEGAGLWELWWMQPRFESTEDTDFSRYDILCSTDQHFEKKMSHKWVIESDFI